MKTTFISLILMLSFGSVNFVDLVLSKQVDTEKYQAEFVGKLMREGGGNGLNDFKSYLETHSIEGVNMEVSASIGKGQIKRFTLDIKSETGIDIKIQGNGFEKFELHWKVDRKNNPYDMWYKFDEEEEKPVAIENQEGKVRVKYSYSSSC